MCNVSTQNARDQGVAVDADQQLLESALAQVLACCSTEEERQNILHRLSPLKTELAKVKQVIENKAVAHTMLVDHVIACNEARDKITQIANSLLDKELSPETVAKLMTDLEETRDQLRQLECDEKVIKTKLNEAGLACKDQSTGQDIDISYNTEILMADIEKSDVKLKFCERILDLQRQMHDVDENLSQLKHVFTDDLDTMGNAIQVRVTNVYNIETVGNVIQVRVTIVCNFISLPARVILVFRHVIMGAILLYQQIV